MADPCAFEAARARILTAALDRAAFDGWTGAMLERAARDQGIDASVLAAALPGGVSDLLSFWSAELDRSMAARMTGSDFTGLRIREKVAFALRARLSEMRGRKESARRAAATLALPLYAPLAARLVWDTADAVWRALGDRSTDGNYYSKRMILGVVWTSTLARWFADDSEDEASTNDFLDRRIDNVMRFEKAKAAWRRRGVDPAAIVNAVSRIRYPLSRS
jgi:ubiquinone biosynthesis protein COQ9